MAGGEVARRGPGRPKGSTNRRAKELAGYVAARFGGSAAQQMAALCMVTPAEVARAGGVLQARVAKARELAEALKIPVAEAFKMLSAELAALAPYTDKRQPQAIEAKGSGWAPSVVVQVDGQVGGFMPTDAEFVEVFDAPAALVSPSKSHGDQQGLDLAEETPPSDAD